MLFSDGDLQFSEFDLQCAVAVYLDHLSAVTKKLTWSHPPNEGKHKPQYRVKMKKAGVKAGEPDCIIYLHGGKTIFIELKKRDGSVSKQQKERHALLRSLGFSVYVVKAKTPQDAVNQVAYILGPEFSGSMGWRK